MMSSASSLLFPPFRLELGNEQLWREDTAVPLRRKTFAVLQHLVERRGQLVTKAQLFDAVWLGTYVGEVALTICITELRKALGDDTKQPRFIETVRGRGYRFIGKVVSSQDSVVSRNKIKQKAKGKTQKPILSTVEEIKIGAPRPSAQNPAPLLVGRASELRQLHEWLEKALNGERQIIFVSGEPGIGKTSIVEAFLNSLESGVQRLASENQHLPFSPVQTLDPKRQTPNDGLWIGRGQCVEQYGAGEAYMPMLEALGRLCRGAEGKWLIEFLSQHAPTWLVQMPALLSATDLESLQRKAPGATRERMLREMAEALETLTLDRPLVLRLEDLHWSDYSTLELISVLARRQEGARLLVLGTYRPVEMLANGHPLRTVKQELQLHKQCEELRLGLLTEKHIAEYLAKVVGARGRALLQTLARLIHRRTEGNPLFMVNVVEYLEAQGGLEEAVERVQGGIPGDLRQMIEEQIHRLSAAERRVLEVASVAGAEFSAAAVAAGIGPTVEEVEGECSELARREQFLQARGTSDWPDGTVAARYSFLHTLYREVLYEQLPAGRRQWLHQQIGEREEQAYGDRTREIAAELAVHFERGREYHKAIQYLRQAGEYAMQRSANQEAISLFAKGLELLKTLPDTPERAQQELRLQIALISPLQAKGFAAVELESVCARVQELCQQVEEIALRLHALVGLNSFYMTRADYRRAYENGEQLMCLAQSRQDPVIQLRARIALGTASLWLGEFTSTRVHLEQGLILYDPHQSRRAQAPLLHNTKVAVLPYLAFLLQVLGYPDQARQRGHEVLTLAQGLAHPFSLAYVLNWMNYLHQVRGEGPQVQERAAALITLSDEQGFTQMSATGALMSGWALVDQEQSKQGITQIRQGLAARKAAGAETMQSYFFALLAEAYGKVGQPEEGLAVLVEALAFVGKTGERFYEPELYRLKGELLLQSKVESGESKVERRKSKNTNP